MRAAPASCARSREAAAEAPRRTHVRATARDRARPRATARDRAQREERLTTISRRRHRRVRWAPRRVCSCDACFGSPAPSSSAGAPPPPRAARHFGATRRLRPSGWCRTRPAYQLNRKSRPCPTFSLIFGPLPLPLLLIHKQGSVQNAGLGQISAAASIVPTLNANYHWRDGVLLLIQSVPGTLALS